MNPEDNPGPAVFSTGCIKALPAKNAGNLGYDKAYVIHRSLKIRDEL